MNRSNQLIAFVFALVLLGGLLGSFLASPRDLWKAVTGDEGTFGERLETVLQTNLPLHEELRNWRVSLKLLGGQQEIDSIFYGKHQLIENLTVKDPAVGERNKAALTQFARQSTDVSCLMLVPTACSILQQLLPDNAILFDQKGWLETCYQELSQSFYTIDAYSILFAARDENLYYRTDPRPTQLAGYKLYVALGDRLGYPAQPLSTFSITPLAHDCYGSLYARWNNGGVHSDTVTAYLPLDASFSYEIVHRAPDGVTATYYTLYPAQAALVGNDMDRILGGASPRIDITTYGGPKRSLLLFGDDAALCLVPFLSLHYSSITVVNPTGCSQAMMQELAGESYDQTLFVFSTETLLQQDIAAPLNYYLNPAA